MSSSDLEHIINTDIGGYLFTSLYRYIYAICSLYAYCVPHLQSFNKSSKGAYPMEASRGHKKYLVNSRFHDHVRRVSPPRE